MFLSGSVRFATKTQTQNVRASFSFCLSTIDLKPPFLPTHDPPEPRVNLTPKIPPLSLLPSQHAQLRRFLVPLARRAQILVDPFAQHDSPQPFIRPFGVPALDVDGDSTRTERCGRRRRRRERRCRRAREKIGSSDGEVGRSARSGGREHARRDGADAIENHRRRREEMHRCVVSRFRTRAMVRADEESSDARLGVKEWAGSNE